jgi:hypothetical protein
MFDDQQVLERLAVYMQADTPMGREAKFEKRMEELRETAAVSSEDVQELIGLAQTIQQAEAVWNMTIDNSTEEQMAWNRQVELCATVEQAEGLFQNTDDGSANEMSVRERWLELCATVEQTYELYDSLDESVSSELREQVLAKLAEQLTAAGF